MCCRVCFFVCSGRKQCQLGKQLARAAWLQGAPTPCSPAGLAPQTPNSMWLSMIKQDCHASVMLAAVSIG